MNRFIFVCILLLTAHPLFASEDTDAKIQLFDQARKAGDEPEMLRLTELIKTEAGEDSAEYRYVRAAKIIWLYAQAKAGKEELGEAKTLLKAAQKKRPEWANIPRALAETALMEGNYEQTIDYLYRVDELGALTAQQLELLVKLLNREGRYEEIKTLVDGKQGMPMSEDIERIRRNADNPEEEKSLWAYYPAHPNPTQDNLMAGAMKDYVKAEEHYRKVVEHAPKNPTGWISLLQALKAQDAEREKMDAVIAGMREALPAEKLPLAEAKAQHILGDAPAAEAAYLKAVEREPENLELLSKISSFYMQTTHPELAAPHLEKILASLEAEQTRRDRLAWAKDALAQITEKKQKEGEEKAAPSAP